MEKIYQDEETVIIVSEKEIERILANVGDIEYALCCGYELELNKTYECLEGYLMIVYDEETCDIDYLLVKTKSPVMGD